MIIECSCMACPFPEVDESGAVSQLGRCCETKEVELVESGFGIFQCSKGNTTITVFDSQKFEFLCEEGFVSFRKFDYSVAVVKFYTAMERLREFVIKLTLLHLGQKINDVNSFWKSNLRRSEPQSGAFELACVILSGFDHGKFPILPKGMEQKLSELRNDVVHTGLIPTASKAKQHCEAIVDYHFAVIRYLRQHFSESVNLAAAAGTMEKSIEAWNRIAEIEPDPQKRTVSFATLPTQVACHSDRMNRSFEYLVTRARDRFIPWEP